MNKPAPSVQTDRFVHDRLPPAEQWPQMRYDLPELVVDAQSNLVDVLFERAEKNGLLERLFLRSDKATLSYADAHEHVKRIAQVLTQDLKLVPGNRVLLRGGNTIAMALAWLGVVKAGLVAVATMPLLRAKELGEVITKSQATVALCDAGLLAELQTAQGLNPVLAHIVPFNTNEAGSLAVLAAAKDGQFTPCLTSADDVAMMAFTSGTTGTPKAPVHTHRDVLAACEAWPRHVLKARPEDIVMGSPPLAFTFGLGGMLIFPMWAGASVYYPGIAYTPEAMVKLINEVGATICYTAPTFYRQMAAFAKQHGVPTLRTCVSAGEGLPDATRQLWKEATGIEMTDGIGATEMFHIFISAAPDQVRRGAIGKVVPGYTARVVDDAGQEVPRGTIGKLAVIGPTGCRYLDDVRQSNYVKDGWNYPGDAFLQDEDGYFFYQARADDMIITSGYNVGGPEVEDALLKHAAVAECGVIGVPDDERGMVVKAFVVLKPGQAADQAMTKLLQDHVKAMLAPFKYPRVVEFVASLPRTETGKLQRFRLRQPSRFSVRKQIRFHHCDPAGIVFYPQYFYLLHETQEDFLAHIGHPEHALIASGLGVPIVDLKTEFLGMCRYGDEIEISLGLSRIGNASIGMHYEIHSYSLPPGKGQALKLIANTVVVCSEIPNGKVLPIPGGLRAALQPYLDITKEDKP